ncbi:MAG: glycosyltransferase family 2 protein, partial [Caldisphaera sp.]
MENTVQPKVSVVCLNYQGKGIVEECLQSLLNNNYKNMEVIFIDNNSSDGSYEVSLKLLSNFNEKIIIRNHKNVGFTKGFNQGMRVASGEYILLLNNDVAIEKDAISNYIKFFDKNKNVGLAEGRIINRIKDIYGYTSNPKIVNVFGTLHEQSGPTPDGFQYRMITRIFSPIGVWPMIRRDVYLKIGGYDEDFFMVEEIRDLAARVWLAGYEVGYVYDAIAYHIGRLTSVKENYGENLADMLLFHATKNSLILFLKNYQLSTQVKYAGPFLLLKFFDFIFTLSVSDKNGVKMKVKAYYWVLKNFKKIM